MVGRWLGLAASQPTFAVPLGQVFSGRGFLSRLLLAASDVACIQELDARVTKCLQDMQVSGDSPRGFFSTPSLAIVTPTLLSCVLCAPWAAWAGGGYVGDAAEAVGSHGRYQC